MRHTVMGADPRKPGAYTRVPCKCMDRTKTPTWRTVVSVTAGLDPSDEDSETMIDWVKAHCAVEAWEKAREGFYPVAVFRGRRKSL